MSAVSESQRVDSLDYADLLRRIGAGDRSAETEFIQRFGPGVRALVRRQARALDPAIEDIAQSVQQSLIEQLRRSAIENPEALPAYVRSAVVFAVRAEYRRRRGHAQTGESEQIEQIADPDTPEDVIRREQLRGVIERLLAELSVERDRQILRLHYLAEQERDEICTRLGIDSSHFHRVLFRARERMRSLLLAAGWTRE